jgi:hypothetical protein
MIHAAFSQVVDYIINAVRKTSSNEVVEDETIEIRDNFSGWQWIVLNVCEVDHSQHRSPQIINCARLQRKSHCQSLQLLLTVN